MKHRSLLMVVAAMLAWAWTSPGWAAPELDWPFEGEHSLYRTYDPPDHMGIEIRAAAGREVKASAEGKVRWFTRGSEKGIAVDHPGGVTSTYYPLDRTAAGGSEVKKGQVIGEVADAGGSHSLPELRLHYGLFLTGRPLGEFASYLNPLEFLGVAPKTGGGTQAEPSPAPLAIEQEAAAAVTKTPEPPESPEGVPATLEPATQPGMAEAKNAGASAPIPNASPLSKETKPAAPASSVPVPKTETLPKAASTAQPTLKKRADIAPITGDQSRVPMPADTPRQSGPETSGESPAASQVSGMPAGGLGNALEAESGRVWTTGTTEEMVGGLRSAMPQPLKGSQTYASRATGKPSERLKSKENTGPGGKALQPPLESSATKASSVPGSIGMRSEPLTPPSAEANISTGGRSAPRAMAGGRVLWDWEERQTAYPEGWSPASASYALAPIDPAKSELVSSVNLWVMVGLLIWGAFRSRASGMDWSRGSLARLAGGK